MKPWTKNTLGQNQQDYIAYNMQQAMATTSRDDVEHINDLEFYFTQNATRKGEDGCEQWLESELEGGE